MLRLRSTKRQAAHEEALREIKSKSQGEILEEWKRDREKILASPLGGLIFPEQMLAPPSLVPSPEEEQQEKLRYQERARRGLNFFLSTPPATRKFDPASPESTDTPVARLNKVPLPKTNEWKRLRHQAKAAYHYLETIRAEDWPEETARHVHHIWVAKGVDREYIAFLWLVSLIGMAGTYRCRKPGLVNADRKKATIQSLPEFLDKPFFREETEALSDEQLAQRIESDINEVEAAGRRDEQFGLNLLPVLFHIDCRFFLRQPWVIALLADWHNKGEEAYVQHAFFGTRKDERSSSYEELVDEIERDAKLAHAVKGLMQTNGGRLNEAIKELGAETATNPRKGKSWMVLGIKNSKGSSTARTAYYRDKRGFDERLIDLFKK